MATKSEKEQVMFSMIETWKNSGQSQQVFCKTQGLAYCVFHYWYKKYRAVKQSGISSPFVAVHFQNTASGSPLVELVLPDGRRLSFYQWVEASYLRTLLS